MDFFSDGAPLGGSHMFHYEPASFDRLRYIKTAAQGNAKWVASTATGEQTWADNLNATQKPIAQAAVDARSKMQTNFSAATQPGGKWERHLLGRGDGYIKSQATLKKGNYSTGVGLASAKQLAALTKIIAYESAGLNTLTSKAQVGSGKTRMNEWYDYMKAGAGTLGAVA
jgi:hypothetical protein